jgi:hypothetical protein
LGDSSIITGSNGAESIILSALLTESIMVSALPAESMILLAPHTANTQAQRVDNAMFLKRANVYIVKTIIFSSFNDRLVAQHVA